MCCRFGLLGTTSLTGHRVHMGHAACLGVPGTSTLANQAAYPETSAFISTASRFCEAIAEELSPGTLPPLAVWKPVLLKLGGGAARLLPRAANDGEVESRVLELRHGAPPRSGSSMAIPSAAA